MVWECLRAGWEIQPRLAKGRLSSRASKTASEQPKVEVVGVVESVVTSRAEGSADIDNSVRRALVRLPALAVDQDTPGLAALCRRD